jgi:hypothetical protein
MDVEGRESKVEGTTWNGRICQKTECRKDERKKF